MFEGIREQKHLINHTRGQTGLLGATILLIYIRDRMMTKQLYGVESYSEMIRAVLK